VLGLVWGPEWFGPFVGSYGRLNQLVTTGSAGRASPGEAVRAMLSAAHGCDSGTWKPVVLAQMRSFAIGRVGAP